MCGRLNVIDDSSIKELMEELGMPVYPPNPILMDNTPSSNVEPGFELKPSETTLTLVQQNQTRLPLLSTWGIKPNWSKSLLINAKSESITEKHSFNQSFNRHRALVVCQGWYEWKAAENNNVKIQKEKYLVKHQSQQPMLMTALHFPKENQFVTLTCAPSKALAGIHHRMPVVIHKNNIRQWLQGDIQAAKQLFLSMQQDQYTIKRVSPTQKSHQSYSPQSSLF
jgi:putative SOS response-associated peptidase YedK